MDEKMRNEPGSHAPSTFAESSQEPDSLNSEHAREGLPAHTNGMLSFGNMETSSLRSRASISLITATLAAMLCGCGSDASSAPAKEPRAEGAEVVLPTPEGWTRKSNQLVSGINYDIELRYTNHHPYFTMVLADVDASTGLSYADRTAKEISETEQNEDYRPVVLDFAREQEVGGLPGYLFQMRYNSGGSTMIGRQFMATYKGNDYVIWLTRDSKDTTSARIFAELEASIALK